MPNKNYIKGRRKEYKVCCDFRKMGFTIVQRTAGSHSPFDVIAIDLNNRKIKLIQCKPDSLSKFQRETIEFNQENLRMNGNFSVEFMLI